MEVSEVELWTFEQVQVVDGLAGGQDRAQRPFVEQSQQWAESSQRLKGFGGIVFA